MRKKQNNTLGLLTFHWAANYGALLQTYALCEVLNAQGFQVTLINLVPKRNLSLINELRHIKFNLFKYKYLPKETVRCCSFDDLRSLPKYDYYCVGSDQVWNKDITGVQWKNYFLDFIEDKSNCISYAASFGTNKIYFDLGDVKFINTQLASFKAVSLREDNGVTFVQENCNIDAINVLDPTLLLTNYSKLIGRRIKFKNDIVVFKFRQDQKFYQFCRQLKKNTGKKVKLLGNNKPKKGFGYIPFPSIKKWIKSIAYAEFVITDSFHATCFAILMRKNFIVLPANPERMSRVVFLLNKIGLSNRLYFNYENILSDRPWESVIDYKAVESKLELLRKKSISFLKKALH